MFYGASFDVLGHDAFFWQQMVLMQVFSLLCSYDKDILSYFFMQSD